MWSWNVATSLRSLLQLKNSTPSQARRPPSWRPTRTKLQLQCRRSSLIVSRSLVYTIHAFNKLVCSSSSGCSGAGEGTTRGGHCHLPHLPGWPHHQVLREQARGYCQLEWSRGLEDCNCYSYLYLVSIYAFIKLCEPLWARRVILHTLKVLYSRSWAKRHIISLCYYCVLWYCNTIYSRCYMLL